MAKEKLTSVEELDGYEKIICMNKTNAKILYTYCT